LLASVAVTPNAFRRAPQPKRLVMKFYVCGSFGVRTCDVRCQTRSTGQDTWRSASK